MGYRLNRLDTVYIKASKSLVTEFDIHHIDWTVVKRILFSFVPSSISSRSRTLEGLFKLTARPSRSLNISSCVASGISEVCIDFRVVELPRIRTPSKTTDANLDGVFQKRCTSLH